MADLEFFFDPVCPWAWITSRWVTEVHEVRGDTVEWRFISLAVVNEGRTEEWYTPEYRAIHRAGHESLRVAAAVRDQAGNDGVAAFYRELGTRFHPLGRRDDYQRDPAGFLAETLGAAGLDTAMAANREDERWDTLLRSETATALARTGPDVGTPIITFRPASPGEASFFGPVIASIPRGDAAVRLWDAIEVIATTSGMAELKRSLRAAPDFS